MFADPRKMCIHYPNFLSDNQGASARTVPADLTEAILDTLQSLEEEDSLVITTTLPRSLAVKIRERIANEVPIPPVSTTEFSAIRALIRLAVEDKRFFDAEIPTLTGMTAEEFLALAARLPGE